jgi:hypothetical protein
VSRRGTTSPDPRYAAAKHFAFIHPKFVALLDSANPADHRARRRPPRRKRRQTKPPNPPLSPALIIHQQRPYNGHH